MGESERIIEQTERVSARNYSPLPVVIARGEGCWVWDANGRKYLDMLSAYSALNQGHRHPRIIQAAKAQLDRLTLTSRAFHNDQMGAFLERLCELSGKERALPMNTGAEAVETAIKAARKWGYTRKGIEGDGEIIVCDNNFHGRTTTIISFSSTEEYREGFGPFTPGFTIIPYGDAEALERAITANTVAFLVEPIQGEGGVVVPPEGYLRDCRRICTENNILLVADEIQTGLGRTGRMFCCDHEGVVPDIYILGKALGGGVYPVSAITADREVMDVFRPGEHGSTFGGNPLAAAVALASLDVIVDEDLPGQAMIRGRRLMSTLESMRLPGVVEIRGKGLLIGVVLDGPARPVCEALMEQGILAKETHDNVVRFAPPLVITDEELDIALKAIEMGFTPLERAPHRPAHLKSTPI